MTTRKTNMKSIVFNLEHSIDELRIAKNKSSGLPKRIIERNLNMMELCVDMLKDWHYNSKPQKSNNQEHQAPAGANAP